MKIGSMDTPQTLQAKTSAATDMVKDDAQNKPTEPSLETDTVTLGNVSDPDPTYKPMTGGGSTTPPPDANSGE